jgi:tetratricopeptide (TPR) repeat protein
MWCGVPKRNRDWDHRRASLQGEILFTIFRPRSQKAAEIRAKGDAARDGADWQDALRYYEQYLKLEPQSAEIWVQYGHALKETKRLSEARLAYEKAISLKPSDSDTRLQMGHVLKLLGNRADAITHYKLALSLPPVQPDAAKELQALGAPLEDSGAADLEQRITRVAKQVERLLGFVSDAKALHFELLHCKSGLEQLRLQSDASLTSANALNSRLTELDLKLDSRSDEVDSKLKPLANHIGRMLEQLSDTKAIHFEMAQSRKEMRDLSVAVEEQLTEIRQNAAPIEQLTTLKTLTVVCADRGEKNARELALQQTESEKLRVAIARQDSEVAIIKNVTARECNDTKQELGRLAKLIADMEERTQEPLVRLSDEVLAMKETLAAHVRHSERQSRELDLQRQAADKALSTIENEQAEISALKVDVIQKIADVRENIVQLTTCADDLAAQRSAAQMEADNLHSALELQGARQVDLVNECARLASEIEKVGHGAAGSLKQVIAQVSELGCDHQAHAAELRALALQAVVHSAILKEATTALADVTRRLELIEESSQAATKIRAGQTQKTGSSKS